MKKIRVIAACLLSAIIFAGCSAEKTADNILGYIFSDDHKELAKDVIDTTFDVMNSDEATEAVKDVTDYASDKLGGVAEDVTNYIGQKKGELLPTGMTNIQGLEVHFIDVGQGDCIFLSADGDHMLVDAGTPESGTKIRGYLKDHGVAALDYLILTHPHADHVGGAASVIYNSCDDNTIFFMPDAEYDNKSYENVKNAMFSKSYQKTSFQVGDTYEFGKGSFTILAPCGTGYEDLNDYSIVVRVDYKGKSFLLAADAETVSETEMLKSGQNLDVDVYKVAHHGSYSSSSDAFLLAMSPEYAVISCGTNNDYGHPHDAALERMEERGITVYRTDIQGTIVCVTDGQTFHWTR